MKVSSFAPKESKKEFEDEENAAMGVRSLGFSTEKSAKPALKRSELARVASNDANGCYYSKRIQGRTFSFITRQFAAMDIGP